MELNTYMNKAREYAIFPLDNSGLDYLASSIPEETGEFSGILAKAVRNGRGRDLTPEERERALGELSDLLWNVAVAAYVLGSSLDTVASKNLNKLEARRGAGKIEGNGETLGER